MTCVICGAEAPVINGVDHQQADCQSCGRYRVSGTAMAMMNANGWNFDVEKTRRWLGENQDESGVPVINSDVVWSLFRGRLLKPGNQDF